MTAWTKVFTTDRWKSSWFLNFWVMSDAVGVLIQDNFFLKTKKDFLFDTRHSLKVQPKTGSWISSVYMNEHNPCGLVYCTGQYIKKRRTLKNISKCLYSDGCLRKATAWCASQGLQQLFSICGSAATLREMKGKRKNRLRATGGIGWKNWDEKVKRLLW